MKSSLLSLILVLSACGTSAPSTGGGGAVMGDAHPEAMVAQGRLELLDLSLHINAVPEKVVEPYIPGAILGGRFFPSGEIVGKLGLPKGRRGLVEGWLELDTRSFYPKTSARAPKPPYVRGAREKESGTFFPISGIVHAPAVAN